MFNLQAHKGYFPIVNLRLASKPANNQTPAISTYLLTAIISMLFLPKLTG